VTRNITIDYDLKKVSLLQHSDWICLNFGALYSGKLHVYPFFSLSATATSTRTSSRRRRWRTRRRPTSSL